MNAVTDAIMQRTSDPNVRAAMLMGSYLESTWNPGSVGDNNTSFGPFQIHLPAHPGVTKQQAQDPQFAVAFMLPAYENGVSQVPSSLWQTNPALAAATAAYKAERPKVMYPSARYIAAWPMVLRVLGGDTTLGGSGTGTTQAGGGGTGTGTGGATDAASTTGSVASSFYPILNFFWMAGIVAGGMLITGIGVYLLITGTVPSTPDIKLQMPKERNDKPQTGTAPREPRPKKSQPVRARTVRTDARPAVKATAGRPQPPKPIIVNSPRGISA